MVLDEHAEISEGAYPFTERDTGHRVRIHGQTVNAMCAVDALGVGDMSGCNVEIDSRCRSCGSPVRITTRENGRALEEVRPLHDCCVVGAALSGWIGCCAQLCELVVSTVHCQQRAA